MLNAKISDERRNGTDIKGEKIGPRMEPWGTPDVRGVGLDVCLPKVMHWVRSVK
jgi:hypothetical protein